MRLIEDLNWRYATKRFDRYSGVSEDDLQKIKEAIRLSASSYGLQPYKVLIIRDRHLKLRLSAASFHQHQVAECSHLFVFCNYRRLEARHIDEFIDLHGKIRGTPEENLQAYGAFLKGKLLERTQEENEKWLARQTYLALANLLVACAALKIDACPMEGFIPEEVDEVLGLTKSGLRSIVLAAVGYRSTDDLAQHARKVRKPFTALFEEL